MPRTMYYTNEYWLGIFSSIILIHVCTCISCDMSCSALLSSDMDGTNNSSIEKLREDCNLLTEKITREVTMIEDANVEVRRLYPEAYLRDITWYERLLGRNNVQEEIGRRPERQEGQQNQQQVITIILVL